MTSWRPPASQAKQDELAIAYARDGYALLEAVYDGSAPAWLREVPAVETFCHGRDIDQIEEASKRQMRPGVCREDQGVELVGQRQEPLDAAA